MEQAIIGLIVAAGSLFSAIGVGLKMLFDRMKALEDDNKSLKEAQEKVPKLEEQVRILTKQIGEMQERLSEAEKTLDGKERDLARLTDENTAQKIALKERDEAIRALTVRAETYERALALVGGERAHAVPEPAPEPAENANEVKQEQNHGTE